MTTNPDQLREGARRIAETLQKAGHIAYWAGGCVRDLLMGRPPKDYDIATNAMPEKVLRLFPKSIEVGKSFGVVRAPCMGHYYEVATFRQDFAYRDGRRPSYITFSDPQTDAQRRDFTVNAMFFDPVVGQLHDFVNGRADLQAKIIRAVGEPDQRFTEDYLRMLRAVRFAGTLDFNIEANTATAIKRHADKISQISAERVQTELTRILLETVHPGDAFQMLADLGLLEVILPEVAKMRGQNQPPQFHPEGDVFTHTVLMLNAMRSPTPILAWAALLHDIGKPETSRETPERLRFDGHAAVGAAMAEQIMRRLRMSNEDIKAVAYCIANHMRFMDVQRMRRATLVKLTSAPTFPTELELHRLDCVASHGDLSNYNFLADFVRARAAEPKLPPPFITGKDLLELGISEGPDIGRWKNAAYEAQLNGQLPDRAAALDWLRAQLRQCGCALPAKTTCAKPPRS